MWRNYLSCRRICKISEQIHTRYYDQCNLDFKGKQRNSMKCRSKDKSKVITEELFTYIYKNLDPHL